MPGINPLPIAAQCGDDLTPCIFRVAGAGFNDLDAQISTCQSIFGIPLVPTVTLPANPIYSTVVETSTYTDIIVSTSTVESVIDQTSTSYATVTKTAVDYTTTIVDAITVTVPAAEVGKRRARRRRGCRAISTSPQLTSLSATTSSPALSSSTPTGSTPSGSSQSGSTPSDSSPASSTPASSTPSSPTPSSSSSSVPSFTIPSECGSQQEYSAACACLVPATVTSYYDAVTTIIYSTEVSTVTSSVEAFATVDSTTVIIDQETSTVTATLDTQTILTTTTTVTAAPAGTPLLSLPAQFNLIAVSGNVGATTIVSAPLVDSDSNVYGFVLSSSGSPVTLSLNNGVITQVGTVNQLFVTTTDTGYASFLFGNPSSFSHISAFTAPACSIDSGTLLLTCSSPSFNTIEACGSGGTPSVLLSTASFLASGCAVVELKAVLGG